ncbi:MAG: SH3 domain-containing protein [Clostridia bacterium]|nr:SH3 domain-containing protein [Clostridia bacterium]
MSENRRKIISEDALEQVTGGVLRTVNTGTSDKAVVRSGPSTGKRQIASLANGVQVDTIGDPVYDEASGRHWIQVNFTDQNGTRRTGWMATSLLGMRR